MGGKGGECSQWLECSPAALRPMNAVQAFAIVFQERTFTSFLAMAPSIRTDNRGGLSGERPLTKSSGAAFHIAKHWHCTDVN